MYGPPGTGKTLFAKVKPCQDSDNLHVAGCSENFRVLSSFSSLKSIAVLLHKLCVLVSLLGREERASSLFQL